MDDAQSPLRAVRDPPDCAVPTAATQRRPIRPALAMGMGALAFVLGAAAIGYVVGRHAPHRVSNASEPNTPYVGFEPARIDLGTQLWGEEVPFQLRIVNGSPTGLAVQHIASTCGCTVLDRAQYEGATVDPQGALTIDAVMRTETTVGKKRADITLTATDGRTYSCSAVANVVGTWSLSESDLVIEDVVVLGEGGSEAFSRTLTFTSTEDTLLDVKPMCTWLDVHVAGRGATQAEILLRGLRKELPPGISIANVVVTTTNPIKPSGAVLVRVRAVPALEATTPHIALLSGAAQRVPFRAYDQSPVRLVSAESPSDRVAVRIVGADAVEITSEGDEASPDVVTVTVTDESGRQATVAVSTFSDTGERQ